jgi:hypothetical protein
MPRHKTFLPGILSGCYGSPMVHLTPRDVIKKAGVFPTHLAYFEDWDFWWRIGIYGTLVPIDWVGCHYRRHDRAYTVTRTAEERALGHIGTAERMCRTFLAREDLLLNYGEAVFWSGWTAYHASRKCGIGLEKLEPLAALIGQIAERGPAKLRLSPFARCIRLMGLQKADRVRNLLLQLTGQKEDHQACATVNS